MFFKPNFDIVLSKFTITNNPGSLIFRAPMSKVYLCADQFANMKITQKEQSMFDQVKIDAEDRGVQVFIGAPGTQCRTDAEAWQRFREIEDR